MLAMGRLGRFLATFPLMGDPGRNAVELRSGASRTTHPWNRPNRPTTLVHKGMSRTGTVPMPSHDRPNDPRRHRRAPTRPPHSASPTRSVRPRLLTEPDFFIGTPASPNRLPNTLGGTGVWSFTCAQAA